MANLEVPGGLSNPLCQEHLVGCWGHRPLLSLLWPLIPQVVQWYPDLKKYKQKTCLYKR